MIKVAIQDWVLNAGRGRRLFLQVDKAGLEWLLLVLKERLEENPNGVLYTLCLSNEAEELCPSESPIS